MLQRVAQEAAVFSLCSPCPIRANTIQSLLASKSPRGLRPESSRTSVDELTHNQHECKRCLACTKPCSGPGHCCKPVNSAAHGFCDSAHYRAEWMSGIGSITVRAGCVDECNKLNQSRQEPLFPSCQRSSRHTTADASHKGASNPTQAVPSVARLERPEGNDTALWHNLA